jgi:5-methylcytosine-specific restriction endonuclease McrA
MSISGIMAFRKHGPLCYLCGRKLTAHITSADHVVPLSRGGRDTLENVRPTCKRCNAAKGNMTLNEFVSMCKAVAARF